LGKYYWEDLDLYLDRSPAKFAAQIETPVLILHGDADPNTFISNSLEMYRALRALGRTVRFLRFPREGHGFTEPHHVRTQYEEILAWLGEHALGLDAARPRATIEPARFGAWELRIAGVRTPENYGGIAPKGAFVEVELLIRAVEPTRERFSLLLFDNSGSEVSLQPLSSVGATEAAGSIYPEGIVAETLGQRVLVKSQGQVIAIQPDADGAHAALAIVVTFDAPATARHFLLRVKDFPAIRIDLPADGQPTANSRQLTEQQQRKAPTVGLSTNCKLSAVSCQLLSRGSAALCYAAISTTEGARNGRNKSYRQ
ncbi:MAG: alpha/beta hydrolase family protein, partial [Candidatus Acidiferrales bacterium]